MTKSERITLIGSLVELLEDEDYDGIDLVLSGFGVPSPARESYTSRRTYALYRLQQATNEQLSELGVHYQLLEENRSEIVKPPAYWEQGLFRLFISHISKFKVEASDIQSALRKFAVSSFVAHEDIDPTELWQNEIEVALSTCDALIALLTPGFHESNWTDQEIGVVFGSGKLVIPIRMGLDPYGFIGKFQGLTAKSQGPTLAWQISDLLIINPRTAEKYADILIDRFTGASTWEEARSLIQVVERIKQLSADQLVRLADAAKTNAKIQDAYGVPAKISSILLRHQV